jgi:hypothetical protein
MAHFLKQIFPLCFLIILISNCKKNSEVGAAGEYRVDPVFEPYVQDFIAEGAKRGKTIDFSDSGLIVEFSDRVVGGASGFCYVGQHHVVIDKSEWFSLSEDIRGFLLFHELGHCELNRGHTNVKFDNNVWQSIMRGSPLEGIEVWLPVPYFGFRKEYYIDELFNEQIAAPTWGNQTFSYDEVPDSKKELIIQEDSISRITQQVADIGAAYEIEIDFNLITDRANITTLKWGKTTDHYYIRFYPQVGFNVDGYFIGVHKDNLDNGLFYSKNTANINGEELHKITIRREGGFEKVFMNDTFIFHIDPLPNDLEMVRFEAATTSQSIDNDFEINSLEVKRIK